MFRGGNELQTVNDEVLVNLFTTTTALSTKPVCHACTVTEAVVGCAPLVLDSV